MPGILIIRRLPWYVPWSKNKIMTTKSNTLMAFTTIEDLTGTMELLVFPRVLTSCRAYLQENAVVVTTGRASVKEDEGTRLIVESVLPVDGYDPSQSFGQNRSQRISAAAGGYGCPKHMAAGALAGMRPDAQGGKPAAKYF